MPRRSLPWLLLSIACAIVLPAFAHGVHGEAQKFGAAVTEKKSVRLDKLARAPEKFKDRTVRVEGVVKDVCQGRGCWIEIEGAKGETFLANEERTHQGRWCYGKTPMQTFKDSVPLAKEKMLVA